MINYIKGDATEPCVDDGMRVIAHICNDIGKFGSGFAGCVAKKWPFVRDDYLRWYRKQIVDFKVGKIQIVSISGQHIDITNMGQPGAFGPNLCVVNMIGQNGVRSYSNPNPINYEGVDKCLAQLKSWIEGIKCFVPKVTIHMPFIGCGLAGGKWDKVEPIIEKHLSEYEVFVYSLK